MSETYLNVGDILQCPQGHDMYEMIQPAGTGQIISASSMKACEGLPEPRTGMLMPGCPVCGGQCIDPTMRPARVKRANEQTN